jgi:excisionase family DNA binding protein
MDDRILTVRDVSEFLQISKAKIYLLIQRNQIPYIRILKNVRIRESDLMAWLDEMTVPANSS